MTAASLIHAQLLNGLTVAKSLKEDWNGAGATPANPASIRAAEKLIPYLPLGLSDPLVGVADGGSIYLKFSRNDVRFVLTVDPNTLHLLIFLPHRNRYLDNVAFDGSTMPDAILRAIVDDDIAQAPKVSE